MTFYKSALLAQRLLMVALLLGTIACGAELVWRIGAFFDSLDRRQQQVERVVTDGMAAGRAASVAAINAASARMGSQIDPVASEGLAALRAATAALREAQGAIADGRGKLRPLDLNARLDGLDSQLRSLTVPAASSAARIDGLLAVAAQISKDHLVERGNGASWPTYATGFLGELRPALNSLRLAANTSQKLLAEEGPPTAKSLRALADNGLRISASMASIAASVSSWIERLTAPPTVKARLQEYLKLLVMAASRFL